MSIQAAFNLILDEYPAVSGQAFAGHPLAKLIREDVPKSVAAHVTDPRYHVVGSAGKGNWARVPWVAVFDTLITDSAQDGFYLVFLVKEDFSGVYLSLNQGVTTVKKRFRADAKEALRGIADDLYARIGAAPIGFLPGAIDLACESKGSLGSFYEQGAIFSRFYEKGRIPDDSMLVDDLIGALGVYAKLAYSDTPSNRSLEKEDDETNFEDLTRIRLHKRVERNQRLAQKVKKIKGYKCEACGFTYKDRYCGLDLEYIEAHHLVPFSELLGGRIRMDPETDFAVLCANCHRMIHRTEFVSDISGFIKSHFIAPKTNK